MKIYLIVLFIIIFSTICEAGSASVSSKIRWAPTGIMVKKFDKITLSGFSGQWRSPEEGGSYCSYIGYSSNVAWNMSLVYCIYSSGSPNNMTTAGISKVLQAGVDGELRFSCIDPNKGDNDGSINVTYSIKPGIIKASVPGLPQTDCPDAIQGLRIVQEDITFTWKGSGVQTVTLAPESILSYTFTFGDGKSHSDSFKVTDASIVDKITGPHKYLDPGLFDINLEVRYIERTFTGGTSSDRQCIIKGGPFKVVVVDQLPEYIAAGMIFLSGSGNSAGVTSVPPGVKSTIFEDNGENPVQFYLNGSFFFYTELPPGSDTGVDPDRFGGVNPSTVKYWVDYADGQEIGFVPWPEAQSLSPNHFTSPRTPKFPRCSLPHNWSEPGLYILKAKTDFKLIGYKGISHDGIIYSWEKYPIPDIQAQPYNQFKFLVADRTPPRIPVSQIRDFYLTTGDPAFLNFIVEDNHPEMNIKEARVWIEKSSGSSKYNSYPMIVTNKGNAETKGLKFKVELLNWKAPGNISVKEAGGKHLKFYLTVKDAAGNVNPGTTSIVEDKPDMFYGRTNPISYGKLIINDNDPPGIYFTLEAAGCIASYYVNEGVCDFFAPGIYGKTSIGYLTKGITLEFEDIEPNFQSALSPSNTTVIKGFSQAVFPEKTRINISIDTEDNVDMVASKIRAGFNGNLKKWTSGKCNFSKIFHKPGNHVFQITVRDKNNLDGTHNFRKVELPVKIVDSTVHVRTLEYK